MTGRGLIQLTRFKIYFGRNLFAPFDVSNGVATDGVAVEDKVEGDGIFHTRLEGEFAVLQFAVPDDVLVACPAPYSPRASRSGPVCATIRTIAAA